MASTVHERAGQRSPEPGKPFGGVLCPDVSPRVFQHVCSNTCSLHQSRVLSVRPVGPVRHELIS